MSKLTFKGFVPKEDPIFTQGASMLTRPDVTRSGNVYEDAIVQGLLRGPYTIEDARYSVELRTMLAYPYGTNAWLPNFYVLKDIVEVYPEVWNAIPATMKQQSPRVVLKRHLEGESDFRVSRKLFNLLLRVGRQEISPAVAIRWLRARHR